MRQIFYWNPDTLKMEEKRPEPKVQGRVELIFDDMPDTIHPATGQRFTSKSNFRRATKAAGCIEVGNEYEGKPAEYFKPKPAAIPSSRHIMEAVLRGEIPPYIPPPPPIDLDK
jgi:hypothetical protein